jgi:hypothetical protein
MLWLLAILVSSMPCSAPAQQASAKPAANLTLYKTAPSAACSGEPTVWVDPETRRYHLKGDPAFGKTRRGGYNCQKHAEEAGYQPARSR